MDSIYLSMLNGERLKISPASVSILWAVDFGTDGYSMALSSDQSYLLVGSFFGSGHLGKLSSSDGSLLISYSSSQNAWY